MSSKKDTYQTLKAELDDIVASLQQDDLDVDKAMEQYERGMKIVEQLETYLKASEAKIKKVKAKFEK
jgi:exodeoxyribonuclease VII small subunit